MKTIPLSELHYDPALAEATLEPYHLKRVLKFDARKVDLAKTDFYTDETGVHPIRDSDGYDPEVGDAKPEPGGRLSAPEIKTVATAISKSANVFRAAGGKVKPRAGGALREDRSKIAKLIDQGQSGPEGFGTSFARSAVDGFAYSNVAYTKSGEVAGAHGYQATMSTASGDPRLVYGNGIFGTTGLTEGAGSALVAEYIKQAAATEADIVIHPIRSAEGFWDKMGMRPLPDRGYGAWGMSNADAKALAKLLG